jgi:hypothetical protein
MQMIGSHVLYVESDLIKFAYVTIGVVIASQKGVRQPSSVSLPSLKLTRHRHRHATEHGLITEHVAEEDVVPEIDPTHGAAFASYGDHGVQEVIDVAAAFLGNREQLCY